MNQTDIHSYLKRFFTENESPIIEESLAHIHVQLSIDMDKALMNRPFYWHYIEKIGGYSNPYKLTLITDPKEVDEDLKGEKIHFGSPRLHQIFNTANALGRHALLYESVTPSGNSQPLKPWLVLNGSVSYCCDHKKDHFFSIGLSLITGEMIKDIYDHIEHEMFQEQIPNYCFTMSPIIKIKSGIDRIKNFLINEIEKDDHTWADEALERWKTDDNLLEAFYDGDEDKSGTYYQEKEAIKAQFEPSIQISIINGGLFYFLNHPLVQ